MPFQLIPQDMIFLLPAVLVALTIHEFAHAFTSYKLGDPTPKYQGRLTLNPVAHIDPMGLLMLVFFRFGWGKPVQVDPRYYGNRRQGTMLVSLAGPVSNIILAFVTLIFYFFFSQVNFVGTLLLRIFELNIILAVFNLMPIPPLDGSKIVASILPHNVAYKYSNFFGQYGLFVLIALVATGALRMIISPIYSLLVRGMVTIVSFILTPFL